MQRLVSLVLATALGPLAAAGEGGVAVDLKDYSPDSGVEVRPDGGRLHVSWPLGNGDSGKLSLDLRGNGPLIESLSIAAKDHDIGDPLLGAVDPVYELTAGSRAAPQGRPPDMSVFNVFFDSPAQRPHQSHAARLELKRASVKSAGRRASVAIGDLEAGPFRGELVFTFYTGSPLIHLEAAVSTGEDRTAFLYEAGLRGRSQGLERFAWMDTEGRLQTSSAGEESPRPIAVRHRTVMAECVHGSLACFPPPHQFFFPRDLTDNLKSVWVLSRAGDKQLSGFGVRQAPRGGGSFVPWFNAPPGTVQRLSVFYLLSRGRAAEALRETLRYTNGDRFPALPGHLTLTSHWHMAVAVAAMERKAKGGPADLVPDFVPMFRGMGVNAVHLAEFHGDGHQGDPGPLRLPELEAMFSECRRLSGPDLLFIPGEEVNDFLGIKEPGKHPGHWMSLFPRPVYWTMRRKPEEVFAEPHPSYGTLYRVGGREDMAELLRREHGLAWTAHPRIKASSWTPDIFRREDFYLSDFWLGAAWKAMPADLSRERLGERALDLLDDMGNWGQRKYLPGEVDVFKIDHTHELYGHMNINYLRLPRLPGFEEGWQPILDALRSGKFFVTTGEVLIAAFTAGGKESGETLTVKPGEKPEVRAALRWTFPMKFAEVISGGGEKVHRERIDLSDTGPFGERTLSLRPDLAGRRWVRLEAWDVAANGAFTQPVWLSPAPAE